MIDPMQSRRLFTLGLATLAAALALPGVAAAQGAQWDDAPPEGAAPGGDELVAYDDRDPAALTDFNAELEPHGAWRDDPTYGRVWVPHSKVVGADFAPYVTSGHWAVADDGGWIWVSDYRWGWVVFHYGRWVWISGTGWAWIPGRQYAHAWVTWRVADPGYAYVGWAPMPPDYVWFDGVAVGVWFGLYTPWVFCPSAYAYHHHMHSYIVHDHHHVHDIAAHSHRYVPPRGSPVWAGPSPKRAYVPANAVPKNHTPAHPKAVAASRQKASDRNAKIVTPGRRPGPGGGDAFRSPRPPSAGPRSEPRPSWPGARPTDRRAPSHAWSPSNPSPPSRPSRAAPPSRSAEPHRSAEPYRSAEPSRASPPSRSAPPSRAPSPGYRSAPPRMSAPAPVPSHRPPAPPPGRPGRRR